MKELDRKRAEASSLSRIGYHILKKGTLDVEWLPDDSDDLGFTNGNEKKVYIAWNNKHYMSGLNENERSFLRKGIFAHELLHQVLTNFSYTDEILNGFHSNAEKKVFMAFANTLEDPAIEYHAPQIFGGALYDALKFSISLIYRRSSKIDESADAFSQLINSLVQFGDMGIIKGKFTHPGVADVFKKIAPLYNEGIICPDSRMRLDIAKECMDLARPIWEPMAKEQEDFEQLVQELIDDLFSAMEDAGLDIESLLENLPVENSGSPAAKRRTQLVEAMEEESVENESASRTENADSDECKKSKDNEQGSSSSANTNDTVADSEKSQKTDSTSGKTSDKDEEPEAGQSSDFGTDSKTSEEDEFNSESSQTSSNTNDSRTKHSDETDLSEDNSSEDNSLDNDSQTDKSTESTVQKKGKGDIPPLTMSEADANELAYSENELSDEQIEQLEKELFAEDKRLKQEAAKNERDAAMDGDLPNPNITSPRFTKAKCLNRKILLGNNERVIETYKLYVNSLEGSIKSLVKSLQRIFNQDRNESRRHTSGRYNVLRGSIGTTAKIFDKNRENNAMDDLAVMFLVDQSGSMNGIKIAEARDACIVLTEALTRLKIPVYVMGFTADREKHDAVHDHYVRWGNNIAEKASLISMQAGGNNFDGYSIRYAGKILEKKSAMHKILFVISDGVPSSNKYHAYDVGISDTKDAIREVRKHSSVFGLAIGHDCGPEMLKYMYGKDFIHVENSSSLTTMLVKKLKELIEKTDY